MITKKLKINIIFTFVIMGLLGSSCFGIPWENGKLEESFPWDDANVSSLECDGNTDLGNCISIKEDEKTGGDDTIIRRLLGVFGLKTDKNDDLKFIDYAKALLNIALSLIAFIALIMSIYTFYLILFSENEKSVGKAKGNLIGIFIALGVIGLARLIVSLIFWRYQRNRETQEGKISTMDVKIIQNIN